MAATGCLYTSHDTDGQWATLTNPCVPVGETRALFETSYSVYYLPAGDTVLYSPGGGEVVQLSLESGAREVVLRNDGVTVFGAVGDNLVYYESDGDFAAPEQIDVIVDRGARSTDRYRRLSPLRELSNIDLITTPFGAYWASYDGNDLGARGPEWRWIPETDVVERFDMRRASNVVYDATSFLYVDDLDRLVLKPQAGGDPRVLEQFELPPDGTAYAPSPLGVDGDWSAYATREDEGRGHRLIARAPDGTKLELSAGPGSVVNGAIDRTYIYFANDAQMQSVFRVPRTGGPIDVVFDGTADPNSAIFDLRADRCNLYWQHFRVDGVTVYARDIVQ